MTYIWFYMIFFTFFEFFIKFKNQYKSIISIKKQLKYYQNQWKTQKKIFKNHENPESKTGDAP